MRNPRPSDDPASRLLKLDAVSGARGARAANTKVLWPLLGVLLLIVLAALGSQGPGGFRLPAPPALDGSASLWLIFITGLTTGGLSCLAVQGGLLATTMARRDQLLGVEQGPAQGSVAPLLLFLGAKLASYTLLGALLGAFGSLISLAPLARGWLQILIGFFMLGVALQMFNVHPVFRYFLLEPPKRVQRLIRRQAKQGGDLTPLFLGALTVFIPCGVTLAIELLALGSGSAARGAFIMFAFVLGTSPLFYTLGFLTTRVGKARQGVFLRFTALAIVVMALYSILGGTRLLGYSAGVAEARSASSTPAASPVARPAAGSAGAWVQRAQGDYVEQAQQSSAGVQEVTITVGETRYVPARVQLKAGVPARLTLITDEIYSCTRAFVIPALNLQKLLPATGVEIIEFTPSQPGQIAFTCSMGMYSGVIEVIQ